MEKSTKAPKGRKNARRRPADLEVDRRL